MKRVEKLGPIFLSLASLAVPTTMAAQQASGQHSTDVQHEQVNQTDEPRDFEGTIMKTRIGETFLLMDYSHRTAYILSDHDAERIKRFDGKKVVVTGTLDPLSNTIMVTTIRTPS
jgi:hypothetical protein